MQKILTILALKGIYFYQKFISPYKGFSCSFRILTDESGCSGYGAKVIKRFGLFTGYKLLQRRFFDCTWAASELKAPIQGNYLRYRKQRGSVDCAPDLDCKLAKCDWDDCCDAPDCGDKKKKNFSKKFVEKRDRKNRKKYQINLDKI